MNAFPAGTGRRIFASNDGSTGTIFMPHLMVGRAPDKAGLAGFTCGGTAGTDGVRRGVEDGANSLENSGDA